MRNYRDEAYDALQEATGCRENWSAYDAKVFDAVSAAQDEIDALRAAMTTRGIALTSVMEAAENRDIDACHELARLALNETASAMLKK